MWFKNLQVYRLPARWAMTAAGLEAALQPQRFAPCGSLDAGSMGWVAPRPHGGLVHAVDKQMLLLLGREKRLLPTSVINQVTKERAAELEEQQGFRVGRKQMKELKEQVADELRPRAFSIYSSTFVWIDPINGWLVVDSSSPGKAEDVLKLLLKAVDKFPVQTLHVKQSPRAAMTEWLASDEAPGGFTVDQDTELQSAGEGRATVRYLRHSLEAEDLRRHIAAGKQCTRLAMTWADRVSFVLTETLAIRRVTPLDVLKEQDGQVQDEDERFDADFLLMAGELGRLLADLLQALGGEENDQSDWVQQNSQEAA
jgi:recombination associated protein RdgC